MLLPDGVTSLEAAGIYPNATIRVSAVPPYLPLEFTPRWGKVLVPLTKEQQEELKNDGLILLKLWYHGTQGMLLAVTLGTRL